MSRPLNAARSEPEHLTYIDAVRGLAFLGVLSIHVTLELGSFTGRYCLELGGYGVQLFFLASAITLCYSMASRQKVDEHPVLYFYLRRFFRIAPMFWIAMAFYLACPNTIPSFWTLQFAPPTGIPPRYYCATALFLHGLHPYTFNSIVPGGWSVGVEMLFYLFFPVLFKWLNSLKKAVAAVLLVLVFTKIETFLLLRFRDIFYPGVTDNAFYFFRTLWFPSQFYVFLIGIAVYYALKQDFTKLLTGSCFWCIGLLCWAVLVFTGVVQPSSFLYVTALAGAIIAISGKALSKLARPWLCYIGKISYSCYLVHFFALGATIKLLGIPLNIPFPHQFDAGGPIPNFVMFIKMMLLSLFLTVAIATATLHLIEKPGIKLGKLLIRWLSLRWSRKQVLPSANVPATSTVDPLV